MLDSVVGLLPAKLQPYAKSLAAAAVAVLSVIAAVSPVPSWVSAVVAVLGAPAIYALPNLKPQPEPAPGGSAGA